MCKNSVNCGRDNAPDPSAPPDPLAVFGERSGGGKKERKWWKVITKLARLGEKAADWHTETGWTPLHRFVMGLIANIQK